MQGRGGEGETAPPEWAGGSWRMHRKTVRKRMPELKANVVTRPHVVPTGLQCPLRTTGSLLRLGKEMLRFAE